MCLWDCPNCTRWACSIALVPLPAVLPLYFTLLYHFSVSPQGHRPPTAPILVQAVTVSHLHLQWPPGLPVSPLGSSHAQHPGSLYWNRAAMTHPLFPKPLAATRQTWNSVQPLCSDGRALQHLPCPPLQSHLSPAPVLPLLQPSCTSQSCWNPPSSSLPQGLCTTCSCTLLRSPELSSPPSDPDWHVCLKCQLSETHRPLTHHTLYLGDLRSTSLLFHALLTDHAPIMFICLLSAASLDCESPGRVGMPLSCSK